MLDLDNVSQIASYSTQEIIAALIWQRRFNHFDGEVVVKDLAKYSAFWSSFVFTRPVYIPDATGLGMRNLVEILRQMAQTQQRSSFDNSYLADTLYVLARQDAATITQLLSLGKKWQADSVELIDSERTTYSRRLQQQLARRLKRSLLVGSDRQKVDGVVICFWWDRSEFIEQLCQI